MKDVEDRRDITFVGLFWIDLHKTLPAPPQRALPLPRPAELFALPAEAQPPAETLAVAVPLAADLRPEEWEWEVLEAAARDEELAQHLMEEEGWVLAEPSAPFTPGVYQ
jgi:hypothetical protein